jgi:hypothetical protein
MGSRRTIARVAVSPGRLPKIIPIKNPRLRNSRDMGSVKTEAPPWRICKKLFILFPDLREYDIEKTDIKYVNKNCYNYRGYNFSGYMVHFIIVNQLKEKQV